MTTLYYADSVRSKSAGAKYVAIVRQHTITADQIDDDWSATLPYGSLGPFESRADALAEAELHLIDSGWEANRADAEEYAAVIAERRNGPICAMLRKLRAQHKARLHLALGLPRGIESVELTRWFIAGRLAVPDYILERCGWVRLGGRRECLFPIKQEIVCRG